MMTSLFSSLATGISNLTLKTQATSQHGEFTVFSLLPVEIQFKIWDFVCQTQQLEEEPRVLPITPNHEPPCWKQVKKYRPSILIDTKLHPCLKPNPLLHACSYTREKLLPTYVLWPCATRLNADPYCQYFKPCKIKILVQPQKDIFHFVSHYADEYRGLLTLFDGGYPLAKSSGANRKAERKFLAAAREITHISVHWEFYKRFFRNQREWRGFLPRVREVTIFAPRDEKLVEFMTARLRGEFWDLCDEGENGRMEPVRRDGGSMHSWREWVCEVTTYEEEEDGEDQLVGPALKIHFRDEESFILEGPFPVAQYL